MKRFLATALVLACLMAAPNLFAEPEGPNGSREMPETEILINEFRAEGYRVLGPVQYLGKTLRKIKLYNHGTLAYKKLDVMDQRGEHYYVNKYDFVYVLSKDGHLVLIHVEREGGDNA